MLFRGRKKKIAEMLKPLPYRECSVMERPLVTREEWDAQPPRGISPLQFPIKNVLFTQTRTEECHNKEDCIKIIQRLQKEHLSSGLSDIQYNFLAGSDFNVYEGRGWGAKPDKNMKYPDLYDQYIEIAYIGSFDEKEPSYEMMKHPWNLLEDVLPSGKFCIEFQVFEDYYQPSSTVEDLVNKYVYKPKK